MTQTTRPNNGPLKVSATYCLIDIICFVLAAPLGHWAVLLMTCVSIVAVVCTGITVWLYSQNLGTYNRELAAEKRQL